jgi:RNA polymerase sigma-70 factor (ECF subfamily)
MALHGVVAIIEREGKILLEKRCEHIADPGTWVLPGGELLPTETIEEALIRVCTEEFGITIRPEQEIGRIVVAGESIPVWEVRWRGKELKLQGGPITAVGWFTMEELMLLEPVRHQEEVRTFLRSTAFFEESRMRARRMTAVELAEGHPPSPPAINQEILAELVARAQEDDHEAFGEIYDLFVTPIYRYVSFRAPAHLVEDLVSDVFVKAWEKLHRYQGRKGIPFSSWLFRIAHNVVIDAYRTFREVEELDGEHLDEDRWNDPTLRITQEIQCVLLRKALNRLPRRYRNVLLLSFMAGLSHAEIARSLRIREGSVRILKHRALRKLAKLLPPSMKEELP